MRLLFLVPLLAFFVCNLPVHKPEALFQAEQEQLAGHTAWQKVLLGQTNPDLKHQRTTDWLYFVIASPTAQTFPRHGIVRVSPTSISSPLTFNRSLQARAPPTLLS